MAVERYHRDPEGFAKRLEGAGGYFMDEAGGLIHRAKCSHFRPTIWEGHDYTEKPKLFSLEKVDIVVHARNKGAVKFCRDCED